VEGVRNVVAARVGRQGRGYLFGSSGVDHK
jgi:hypothetical protein